MFRKYAFTGLVAGLVISIVTGLMLTSDAQQWAMITSAAFILFLPVTSRPLAVALAARAGMLLVLGIGLAALGIAAMVAGIALWPNAYNERAMALSIWALLAGAAVGYLPFMSRRLTAVWADIDDRKRSPPAPPPLFSATDNVMGALGLLVHQRVALARVAGPWFLLFCVLPLAVIRLDLKDVTAGHSGPILAALLGLLAFILILICLPLVASIQWARFLATGQQPRLIDVPLKAVWGFLWRLFFSGIVLRTINGAEPWLKAHMPAATPWMISGLSGLFSLAVLVLASPFAMIFVAVAINAPDQSMQGALRRARGVGRRFYLGMLLILTPPILASWVLGLAPAGKDLDPTEWLQFFVWALVFFLTLVVATTYLTRVYLLGEANAQSGSSSGTGGNTGIA
jgi:hypothetical protein